MLQCTLQLSTGRSQVLADSRRVPPEQHGDLGGGELINDERHDLLLRPGQRSKQLGHPLPILPKGKPCVLLAFLKALAALR